MKALSSREKELAKIEKKKAKAELNALKKQGQIIGEPLEAKKDWRSNIWLYIVVATLIGLIVWGLTNILSKIFS